MKNTLDI